MSRIEREEVERVARLARLTLSDDEVERLRGELEGILRHVDELPETGAGEDLDPAEIASGRDGGAGAGSVALRPDVPGADALAFGPGEMAPEWRGGFFIVPRLPAMRVEGGREETGG